MTLLTELDWARFNNAMGRMRARLDDERWVEVQPDLSICLDTLEKFFDGGERCTNAAHRGDAGG